MTRPPSAPPPSQTRESSCDDIFRDARRDYDEAMERLGAIRREWHGEGEPLLSVGSTGQPVEHPLVKMLRETEAHVKQLRADLRARHRGPVPSAVPGIVPSPAAKLRAVK